MYGLRVYVKVRDKLRGPNDAPIDALTVSWRQQSFQLTRRKHITHSNPKQLKQTAEATEMAYTKAFPLRVIMLSNRCMSATEESGVVWDEG